MSTASETQNLFNELKSCLDDELHALLADDLSALASTLQRKGALMSRLCELSDAHFQGGDKKNSAWPHAIGRLRRLNTRNALALAGPMQFKGARLRFLQAAMGRATLYGADGSMAAPKGFDSAFAPAR